MKRIYLTAMALAAVIAASAQNPDKTEVPADTILNPYSVSIADDTALLPDSVEWAPSPLSYGLFVGTGPRWTAGRLNQYFSWAWDFTFGAKIAYNRWYLEAAVSFASPTLRKPELTTTGNPDTKFRANVKNANYTAWGFNAGYAVFSNHACAIIPFAGVKWTSYSWTSRPLEINENGDEVMSMPQQKMKVKDFNIDFGVNFDWHFSNIIVSGGEKRQSLQSSLRITPYAVRGVYSSCQGPFNGWQTGVMIAYSATARQMKPLGTIIP